MASPCLWTPRKANHRQRGDEGQGPGLRQGRASDAIAYAITVPALLLTDGKPIDSDLIQESGIRTASWLVAGFSVMADWIGSNQQWFPYRDSNWACLTTGKLRVEKG